MKNMLLIALTSTVASLPAYAINYNSFIAPSSLGKDVEALNKQYKLGLKKQNWNGYSNDDSASCQLHIEVNKKTKSTQLG